MRAEMICAWCGEKMHNTETVDGSPSHGICKTCLRLYFPDLAVAIPPDPEPETALSSETSHSDPPHAE